MENFPVFLNLKGRRIVIAGGGDLAVRKARLLLAAHAHVVLIAPDIDPAVRQELAGKVTFVERHPVASDFADMPLAVIAHEDRAAQLTLAQMARSQGPLVNVVDAPDLCDFTTPSIIDRGDVVVAISTNGVAPVYGRNLREQIERMLPQRLEALTSFAAAFRASVRARFGDATRRFWETFFEGPIAQRVLSGDEVGAREAMISVINRTDEGEENQNGERPVGTVHIVGAGPGDAELLTIRAHRLLQTADVILFDRLVSEDILNLARRDADRIFVGKAKANHAVPQEDIHELLISLAREGKSVVRLKGGDPFIFGRGGEELDALRAADIPAFVTPGITAATGCAASSGMALTHRDYSQAVTFVTGHAKGEAEPDLNWQALADLQHTLVVYMGVGKSETIANRLIAHGRNKATPIAVIENGSRHDEIIARGTLGTLALSIKRAGIKGPAILVIGEVATLADIDLNAAARQSSDVVDERLTA